MVCDSIRQTRWVVSIVKNVLEGWDHVEQLKIKSGNNHKNVFLFIFLERHLLEQADSIFQPQLYLTHLLCLCPPHPSFPSNSVPIR